MHCGVGWVMRFCCAAALFALVCGGRGVSTDGDDSASQTRLLYSNRGSIDHPEVRIWASEGGRIGWQFDLPLRLQSITRIDALWVVTGESIRRCTTRDADFPYFEVWTVDLKGGHDLVERVPQASGLDGMKSEPHMLRVLGLSDSRVMIAMNLSRAEVFANCGGGEWTQIEDEGEPYPRPNEFWWVYDVPGKRYMEEIWPSRVIDPSVQQFSVHQIEPLREGEFLLVYSITALGSTWPSAAVFGARFDVLDSQWRSIWHHWSPHAWDAEPRVSSQVDDSGRWAAIGGIQPVSDNECQIRDASMDHDLRVRVVVDNQTGRGRYVRVTE